MGVDIQGKLRLALGSVKDHASIGKAMIYHHQHYGLSSIEIAVLRATGHDNGTIDDKHMHEILFLVSNSPGSIPFLAERISRRLCKTKDRFVALKILVLIHRLLRGGTRSFEQELRLAHASNHLQINNVGCAKNSDHPSALFLQKYAVYLEERMSWLINQAGKLEPVMSKGSDSGFYDEKSIDMVFRKLPKCQVFIDKVLDCPLLVSPSDNLTQAAMSNILKESFHVYMAISEGIAALVNMFFGLSSSARGFACKILQKASLQSRKLHDLYETCKQIMENKNLIYPPVQIMDMEHVIAMEQCLSSPVNKPETSYASLARRITCSKTPQILRCLSKSKGLHVAIAAKPGKKKHQPTHEHDSLSPQTPFSCTLETVVSKVWVVFEDEDTNGSEFVVR